MNNSYWWTARARLLRHFFGLILCASACAAPAEEIARAASPDGVVEAVIARQLGSTTVASIHEVYVVPAGRPIKGAQPVLISTRSAEPPLSVEWLSVGHLAITHHGDRIDRYQNYWWSRDVERFEYRVEVHLLTHGRVWRGMNNDAGLENPPERTGAPADVESRD